MLALLAGCELQYFSNTCFFSPLPREKKSCNLHYFIFFNWTLHLNLQTRCLSIFKECYRKIPKISPGTDIFQRPFLWGLFLEGLIYGGNLRFKINRASPIVGSKFTVFALFYFVFEGNFQVQTPGGRIFGGAYTWRGLFSQFYDMLLAAIHNFLTF